MNAHCLHGIAVHEHSRSLKHASAVKEHGRSLKHASDGHKHGRSLKQTAAYVLHCKVQDWNSELQ